MEITRTNLICDTTIPLTILSAEQLTPLADSSDAYSLQQGNVNLKPYRRQNIAFNFNHNTQHSRNDFGYGLNISVYKTDDNIIDSSYYDNSGKRIGYLVNVGDGVKGVSVAGSFQKSFKFQKNQLQLRGNTNFSVSKSPSYVNGVFNLSNSFNNNSYLNVYYTYGDILNLSANQSGNFYHSKSEVNKYNFKNATLTTSFSASVNCTKRLNVGSNVNYNHSTSSNSSAICEHH
ncbi:hypothetical protein [Arachidicoccus sp.]|uniref:hypothetical protein n=1 Tax=Arachidicoccus sp. TaxID=1872624 RepID=UPI003D213F95